jgi:hypothetical protein
MKADGSCHCGSVQFDADLDADNVIVCHCTDCGPACVPPFLTIK